MLEKYDLVVIGGGSGGLVCAAGAASLGAHVALIEKKKLGGDCLNTGCVPSKALIKSARMIHEIQNAEKYGIKKTSLEFDFKDIMDRVRQVQATIEPHDSREKFESLGVSVKFGNYEFMDGNRITNGSEILQAKRFVIATGSSPFIPTIEGLDPSQVLTSENIWGLEKLPKSMIFIGGGPISSELSQCMARFGSQVTLLDRGAGLLHREDRDMAAFVQEAFVKDDMTLNFNGEVTHISHEPHLHHVTFKKQNETLQYQAEKLFLALGRTPTLHGLGLEKVGIQFTPQGIGINQHCETNIPHIYACGDVAGPYQFTHFADYQARIILRNALFPGKSKVDYRVIPWCTYTDPELARVGLSEKEVKEKKISHQIIKYELNEHDRAVCDSENHGLVKIITEKRSDKILGASIVGPHAGDLLQEFTFAMKNNAGLKAISKTIHPYPTMTEISKRTADEWMRRKLTPIVLKALKFYFKKLFR
ncbi:MAG: dihydrolipoyl dehydrogenase [Deltaproteobacteria bacterium]|nr:dihydrolipoyl dehydrogenase [Deltaproteobacteria bacterium]